MRPWAKWCLAHRLTWAVYAVHLAHAPLYFLIGCFVGCKDTMGEWASDWKFIGRVAMKGGQHD